MTFELTDDGTMDTVLRCSDCGGEQRFTDYASDEEGAYAEWVEECVAFAESDHECPTYFVDTWFERDRAHVALYFGTKDDGNADAIVEWWDEAVAEAVEDGFLNPRDWLGSALHYARNQKLVKES